MEGQKGWHTGCAILVGWVLRTHLLLCANQLHT